MDGKLLLVIPPVVRIVNGTYEVETDFSNNLRIYLENFKHVTFACPALLAVGTGMLLSYLPDRAALPSSQVSEP